MKRTISVAGLSEAIKAAFSEGARRPAPHDATAPATPATALPPSSGTPIRRQRTAVFVIHGISPIQRYAMQDQFADGLFAYIQAHDPTGWIRSVKWPHVSVDAGLKPSAIRISRPEGGETADTASAYIDIFEGYWSPLSKGKATIASLLQWLLNITFLANSSTASIPADWAKLWWDVRYLCCALFGAAVLAGVALIGATFSWQRFVELFSSAKIAVPDSVQAALNQALGLKWSAFAELLLMLALGYCIVQLCSIARTRWVTTKQTATLEADRAGKHLGERLISAKKWHAFTAAVFVAASCFILVIAVALAVWIQQPATVPLALAVVLSVAAVQGARAIADFIVVDVLGDVQVYCTHEETAEYFAVRRQIIDTVSNALLGVLKSVETPPDFAVGESIEGNPKPLYDQIHIAAHSLGSTIGLDVLMQIRMLVNQGSVSPQEWDSIKSFVTFGTSLEKTRFLFDVRKPTVSAAHDQWDADVYGRFFSDVKGAPAIYWHNLWYFRDIVANEIVSYTSDVPAGAAFDAWNGDAPGHVLCGNTLLVSPEKNPLAFVHGDYLADPKFWEIAGAIVTS